MEQRQSYTIETSSSILHFALITSKYSTCNKCTLIINSTNCVHFKDNALLPHFIQLNVFPFKFSKIHFIFYAMFTFSINSKMNSHTKDKAKLFKHFSFILAALVQWWSAVPNSTPSSAIGFFTS